MTADLMFTDVEIPADETPAALPTDSAPAVPELACKTCGKELSYSGRGRKPVYCDEHKKSGSTSSGVTRSSKRSDAIAREAAQVLSQVNGLIGIGLMVAPEPYRMPGTAAKLDSVADKFEDQAYTALLASPALARTIARAGGVSGSAGLIIAYAMLASSIAPVAMEEWKDNRKASAGE